MAATRISISYHATHLKYYAKFPVARGSNRGESPNITQTLGSLVLPHIGDLGIVVSEDGNGYVARRIDPPSDITGHWAHDKIHAVGLLVYADQEGFKIGWGDG